MRFRRILTVLAFLLAGLPALAAPPTPHATAASNTPPRYSVIDLGAWYPYAINSGGEIVGWGYDPKSGNDVPVRWHDGELLILPALAGGVATDINNAGQIAGYAYGLNGSPDQAFRWQNGAFTPLGAAGGDAYANAINTSGQAAGEVEVYIPDCNPEGGCWDTYAARWNGAQATALGFLTGNDCRDVALDINDSGVIAGYVEVGIDTGSTFDDCYEQYSEYHGVIWRPGGIVDLGLITEPQDMAINNAGVVVGNRQTAGGTRATLWDQDGWHDLGSLGQWSEALDINNSRQVTGFGNDPVLGQRAILWENGTLNDLNTLINAKGWLLKEARAINDTGQIVGVGELNGIDHGFLLVPRPTVPLIFIPGITGSYLDSAVGDNVWFSKPPYTELTLDPQQQQPVIEAGDAIRAVYGPLLDVLREDGGYNEYKVRNSLDRTTAGCDLSQRGSDPMLFVFAYDWRRSNAENADRLDDYIGCIQRFYPNTQVDIVTHSMGGLLSRHYILDHPGRVRKLVTIGTPWVGVPQALYALETGELHEAVDPAFRFLTAIRDLVRFWPGVHELLPAPTYFDLGGRPFAEMDWDINANGKPQQTYDTQPQLTAMLDRRFPRSRPGSANRAFFSTFGQTDWRGDQSGVRYYHIVGSMRSASTIGQVLATSEVGCIDAHHTGNLVCKITNAFDVRFTQGDGTVPLLSAMRAGNGLNLNAPNARIIPFFDQPKELFGQVDLGNHIGLMYNPNVRSAVLALLSARPTTQASLRPQDEDPPTPPEPPPAAPAHYLRISGTAALTLADSLGNSTAPVSDTIQGSMPTASLFRLGDQRVAAVLEADGIYTATLHAGAEPLMIDLTTGTDEHITNAVRWLDLALPAGVTAALRLSAGEPTLAYDGDGDGAFETPVAPTLTVTGAAADDTTPPTVQIAATGQGATRTLTVTANDTGAGVGRVFFSLDGETFEPYQAPLVVDVQAHPRVYAFAEDNVGNRGVGVYEAWGRQIYLPLVSR